MLSMILCTDSQGGIGKNNSIPWHESEDMKFFKEYTIGKDLFMGYNTWKSLPKFPLPNRKCIVLLSKMLNEPIEQELLDNPNVEFIIGSDNILSKYKLKSENESLTEGVIIGGASLYNKYFGYVDTILLTRLDKDYDCDVKVSFIDNLTEKYYLRNLTEYKNIRFETWKLKTNF